MESFLQASNPRGRPVGSKNKRKEPEPSAGVEQAIQLKALEVAAGADVISAVSDFAKRFNVDVSVLSTHGLVNRLTVYQPKSPPQISPVFTFEGVFNLVSLKGNFHGSATQPSPCCASPLIYVFDSEGNAVGGIVAGKVLAATKVVLVVAIMRETDCIKLPLTPQANEPIVAAHQPEVYPIPRGYVIASPAHQPEVYSVPRGYVIASPAPPLRMCNRIANGYLCTCALK